MGSTEALSRTGIVIFPAGNQFFSTLSQRINYHSYGAKSCAADLMHVIWALHG
jgi:hypothetical protein